MPYFFNTWSQDLDTRQNIHLVHVCTQKYIIVVLYISYGTSQLLSLVQSLKTYIDRTTTLSNLNQSFRFFYPTKLDLTLYTLYFLR